MSSGKCSVRIKGSSGIETPDSSGKIYNGVPFRKRIYRQFDEPRADLDARLFGYNAAAVSGPPVLRQDPDEPFLALYRAKVALVGLWLTSFSASAFEQLTKFAIPVRTTGIASFCHELTIMSRPVSQIHDGDLWHAHP
jgi:hypothetical protein